MAHTNDLIPVFKSQMGEPEAEAARRALMSGSIIQGPEVKAFEEEFAAYVGAEFACATSSGTTNLHLALKAVGVGPGDEVITVSHSFIATANSIRYCGAVPVFVDIDPATFNMDPNLIEPAISERTRAIMTVPQIGMPCDMASIMAVARRHGIPVVEDAANAAGSEIDWKGRWEMVGAPHGDIACFSFHPRKLLTTGEGGMLTTGNPDFDSKFRLWRSHAMAFPSGPPTAETVAFETFPELGYNYRLTDLQAAVGREQLIRLPGMLEQRRTLAARYARLLAEIPGVSPPHQPEWARSNWQCYCVRIPHDADQRHVMQSMLDDGVSTIRGILCAHRQPAYAKEPWRCGADPDCPSTGETCVHLRNSEAAQDHSIIIPLFPDMTNAEQDRVVEALARALRIRN